MTHARWDTAQKQPFGKVPRLYGKDVHLLIEHQPEGRGLLGYSLGMEAGEHHAPVPLPC